MTRIYVDATTLVSLGQVGELDLLTAFDGTTVIPSAVRDEVTTEPARTNLSRFLQEEDVGTGPSETDWTDEAIDILAAPDPTSGVRIIEGVLAATDDGDPADTPHVGVVSDDRRLRTVAKGFGAEVTGTFGVVVRAASADKYFSPDQAKRIVRRIDSHGLHLTGELREQTLGSM